MIPAHRDAAFRMMLIAPLAIALVPAPASGQTIWVEGEKPARATMSRHPGWYDQVSLTRGRHTISFRMSSENHHHGVLDAFVFSTRPFLPSGTMRPGEAKSDLQAGAGTWPFLPERDTFSPQAMFDLRNLNEKVAGQSGFVRLSPDGDSFVLGDGSPVRFWGVTTYVQRDRSAADLAHHARFLAKRGVNMVRLHGELESKDKGAKLADVDRKTIDEAWKLVAAMKKEGIYTTISPYWAASLKHVPASWGASGAGPRTRTLKACSSSTRSFKKVTRRG